MSNRRKSALEKAEAITKMWAFPDPGYGPIERKDIPRMTKEIISVYLAAAHEEMEEKIDRRFKKTGL